MNTSTRVLVVDDSEDAAHAIREHLLSQEYDVEVLKDSRSAFELLITGEQVFDLLILDLYLPGLDGLTLTKRIRQKGILVPVFLKAPRVPPDLRLSITALGPSVSYLDWEDKGNSRELLLAAVLDLLSRNQFMSAVCKVSNRLDDLHTLFLEKMPSPADESEIEARIARGLAKVSEGLKKELITGIEEATDIPRLITRAQEHPMSKIVMGLCSVILTVYMGFSWYSYTLADQSSQGVTEVRFKVQEMSTQMTRIEDAISDLVDERVPTPRRPSGGSVPPTPTSTGRSTP